MSKYATPKRLEDLNVIDSFMFNELTMQEDREKAEFFCKTILEPIIGHKIRNLEIVPQKMYQGIEPHKHGIMMDAYIRVTKDEFGNETTDARLSLESTIYDLEPNIYVEESEEKRARFYHSLVDSHIFSSGQKYTTLDSVVVIFIFPYDPFGYDRMLYTVKRKCLEEPDMPFNDGDTTYFLNATGTKDIPSQSLKNMLSFLIDSSAENAKNEELKAVRNMMNQIKQDRQMGVKYMYTWERENHIRNEGIEEGIKQGIDKKICDLISTKLSKGKSISQIADEIEESEDKVLELIHQYNLK